MAGMIQQVYLNLLQQAFAAQIAGRTDIRMDYFGGIHLKKGIISVALLPRTDEPSRGKGLLRRTGAHGQVQLLSAVGLLPGGGKSPVLANRLDKKFCLFSGLNGFRQVVNRHAMPAPNLSGAPLKIKGLSEISVNPFFFFVPPFLGSSRIFRESFRIFFGQCFSGQTIE